jgi:hypothetical protein
VSVCLNNITTANGYTAAAELVCDGSVKLNLQVEVNPIYYSYMPPDPTHPNLGGSYFNPEVRLGVGSWLLVRRASRVRVRSALEGRPATVTIEALGPAD